MSRLVQILEGLPIEEELPILGPQDARIGARLTDNPEISAFVARNGSWAAYEKFGVKALQTIAAKGPQVAEVVRRIQDQLRLLPSGVDVASDRGVQKAFSTLDAWL